MYFIMKRTISFIAAICIMFASCNKQVEKEVEELQSQNLVPVAVRVSDFFITQEEFENSAKTRALYSVEDYQGITILTLLFYKGTTEVYKCTQVKADPSTYTTFGGFSTSLPMGDYTMLVIGNGGSNVPTITGKTSATYGENTVGDTYVDSQEVNIHNTSAISLEATLNRVNSMIAISSTDVLTADAPKVRITTTTGGKSFNPITGFATVNTGFSSVITPSSAVGNAVNVGIYLFLATDEQTTDVTIETLDADDNTLFSKTIQNVSVQRNRRTIFKGAMYTNNSLTTAFQVESDWMSNDNEVQF